MQTPEEPANLRFLRRLVTTLTAVMVAGLLVVITLLVIRLTQPSLPFPDAITLPDGTSAVAFTQGRDWYAVVTEGDQILIYNRSDNSLRKTIPVN